MLAYKPHSETPPEKIPLHLLGCRQEVHCCEDKSTMTLTLLHEACSQPMSCHVCSARSPVGVCICSSNDNSNWFLNLMQDSQVIHGPYALALTMVILDIDMYVCSMLTRSDQPCTRRPRLNQHEQFNTNAPVRAYPRRKEPSQCEYSVQPSVEETAAELTSHPLGPSGAAASAGVLIACWLLVRI